MNKQEEQQLLRNVQGLYDYKVRSPDHSVLGVCRILVLLIGSFLMVGVAGALTRLFS